MSDLIEQPALLIPEEPRPPLEWPSSDDTRLATLSHFGAPYIEGDTPLFI